MKNKTQSSIFEEPQEDYVENTEQYLEETFKNAERSFTILGRVCYKLFYMIAGGFEQAWLLISKLLGIEKKEEEYDVPF